MNYAELHSVSNFSFLRGASHPEELVETASALNYQSLAITDECSLAGAVKAHQKAKELGLHLILGAEFLLEEKIRIVLLAKNQQSYGDLCQLISKARQRAKKGTYTAKKNDIEQLGHHCIAILSTYSQPGEPHLIPKELQQHLTWLASINTQTRIALTFSGDGRDKTRFKTYREIAKNCGISSVATGNVHFHHPNRLRLQHVLTAIRLGIRVADAGFSLQPNTALAMHKMAFLERHYPADCLTETLVIAEQCQFNLDQITYSYPKEYIPQRSSPYLHLKRLCIAGMKQRWPDSANAKVRALILHELTLIHELSYEAYFLTVYDIVTFARSRNILCQGRGSAANSAVCFCLGITEVDPSKMQLLFERFISRERNEPPDIDVDFEHERREEVMQYIYRKYGRNHAALTATVISYRPKSAIRDVGKSLGLGLSQIELLSANLSWWDGTRVIPERLKEIGINPEQPQFQLLLELANEIIGFPRHLSQHTGGFVISDKPINRFVPIENASMDNRTVIEWDKNDINAVGLLKVDCLSLGMLTAIHKSFDLIEQTTGKKLTISTVPADDSKVYDMICRADTIGVFQIESRAQMSMLPRLRPRNFYDLVIEVALVRPGPIQGDMVHPYLKRRQGLEEVTYPSESVKQVLERTLGIPIFQEQVIKLAIVAAGFTAGEADGLRRSMAAWRRRGGLEYYHEKLISGMLARGYRIDFAERIYKQILGFGEYGFPESHAASFALLVYVSCWIKYHHPAVFTCALLNSQPMGFYAPAQLIQDVQRHDVKVLPIDINHSQWDSTLEASTKGFALRLGFRLIKHLGKAAVSDLLSERQNGPFKTIADMRRRTRLYENDMKALAAANCMSAIGKHRYQTVWELSGIEPDLPMITDNWPVEPIPLLKPPNVGEDVRADYISTGLSLGPHPLQLLRSKLNHQRIRTAALISNIQHGTRVRVAGIVTCRQRPSSANNVAFVTLEDETGYINLVIWKNLADQQRQTLSGARLMAAYGEVQSDGTVIHIIAKQLRDYSYLLGELPTICRDFR